MDTTWAQVATDALVLLVVAVQVGLGWQLGLVRRAFALAGSFAAVVAASYSGNALAGIIRPHSTDADMLGFVIVFLAVSLLFEILGALGSDRLRGLIVVMFDRVSGAVAGAILGVLQVGVVVLVTLSATARAPVSTTMANTIRSATLGNAIVALEPGVRAVMTPVLPAHLDTHLAAPENR